MIQFKPFRGFVPGEDFIRDVAVRSTDFHSDEEIIKELKENELAFLHVTKSNLLHPERNEEDENYFISAQEYVRQLMENNQVVQDKEPVFYLYRQTTYSGTFVGIIGLCDVLDYQDSRIKKHENTRIFREKWVARLVSETKSVGEPVLLAHTDHPDIQDAIGNTIVNEPEIKFVAKNNSVHEIWRIGGKVANHIQEVYEQLGSVYIMDGHHRSASFARLYAETGDVRYRYFQAMMLTSFNIRIWPFHRLVKLTDRSVEEFLEQLKGIYTIEESEHNLPVLPDHKGHFGVYLKGRWYNMHNGDDRDKLDVSLLEEKIFRPVLHIQDTRSDERLEYLRGNHTIEWLQNKTNESDTNVLITMYPCTFEDIQRVSDMGETMPPKSTYIEPKGRSGMIIHHLQ